jgi:hypothetical protein
LQSAAFKNLQLKVILIKRDKKLNQECEAALLSNLSAEISLLLLFLGQLLLTHIKALGARSWQQQILHQEQAVACLRLN